MLLKYLKEEKKSLYLSMYANDTLNSYLEAMDIEINNRYDELIEQYKIERYISEELKESNQMEG